MKEAGVDISSFTSDAMADPGCDEIFKVEKRSPPRGPSLDPRNLALRVQVPENHMLSHLLA